MDKTDREDIRKSFNDAVNMAPGDLSKWLETEHSREVGWAGGAPKTEAGGKESVGHHSGARIVEIKRKHVADLTDADYAHMKKVVGYVHRHLVQKPQGDVSDTRWRYSLMNWGHDPLKD
jgi:hypothetical protein